MILPGSQTDVYRKFAIGLALMTLLVAVYLVTFNGFAISRDEWFLFDATESIARRGTLEQNLQYDAYPPTSLAEVEPRAVDSEPLQPILAAPLFLIAQTLPGIGLAHTVWLFNLLVTGLTAGTLYLYGLNLGYSLRVAAPVALIFGLGTIAWPYSRTFFREPLFTWLTLLSLFAVHWLRRRLEADQRPSGALLLLAVALAGTLLAKEAALLVFPALFVEALPARFGTRRFSRRMIASLVILALLMIVLVVLVLNIETWFGVSISRYAFKGRLDAARRNLSDLSTGIMGYLFSPARSIWLFSPVLILGFLGWPRLIRQGRWRQVITPAVMAASFVVGYAAVRGADTWYGGVGWGARYMVPLTPVLALWLLPVTESLIETGTRTLRRVTALAVLVLSVGAQILAALVPIQSYSATLNAQQPPIIAWEEGAWSWRWSPWRIYLDLVGDVTPDIAWKHAVGPTWLVPLTAVLLASLALGWLIWWLRSDRAISRRIVLLTATSLSATLTLALGVSLYAIRQDPRYSGNFKPLRDLLTALDSHLQSDDVVVLNDFTYQPFFMNYYKHRAPIVYTLPPSPGERSSPDTQAEVTSADPNDLILPAHTISLNYLAQQHERLWLVINSSPFVTFAVRPVEQYLTRHYFPVMELAPNDVARAVLFETTPAPSSPGTLWPEHVLNADFGDSIRLVGYDTPEDRIYDPGAIVPVSLLWQARAPIPLDYTVGIFVISGEGQAVAQRDSFPANAFDPTQHWRPGSYHRDNHGILLPAGIAPGDYELWAVVYHWQNPDQRLPVSDVSGRFLGDHLRLGTLTIR